VRVAGGLPADFLGLWCHGAVEVVVVCRLCGGGGGGW
jgi:hypothetical protein